MDQNQGSMEQNKSCANCSKCNCPHHKVVPVLIVLFGVLFLLRAFNDISQYNTNIIWPIIVIIAGLSKTFKGMCKCCSK